jgi:hypothetical protein
MVPVVKNEWWITHCLGADVWVINFGIELDFGRLEGVRYQIQYSRSEEERVGNKGRGTYPINKRTIITIATIHVVSTIGEQNVDLEHAALVRSSRGTYISCQVTATIASLVLLPVIFPTSCAFLSLTMFMMTLVPGCLCYTWEATYKKYQERSRKSQLHAA